jgi:cell wall-associated NlpC family hydrolase
MGGAPVALAAGGGVSAAASAHSGGAGIVPGPVPLSTPTHPIVPGAVAKIIHGVAYAPSEAPLAVQQAIWAGNRIRHKPYIYGGGHGTFNDTGYDCSGTVSYVLHAAGLLSVPMDSSEFMTWAGRGHGHWMTIYTNPGHAFIQIAGIRLDTSSEGDPNYTGGSGPRWRPLLQDTNGFMARHPRGY